MLPIKAGDQLKHYRILEKLGEGGMGVVYRAEDIRLGRQVAIKFLPTDAAHDPALRKRFQQEARAAAAISHPAIATVFDVGEDNDQSYIVFEFVPGTTLRTFVKPGGVGLEPLLDIALDIAGALEAAHEHRIVHRDLKPDNVMRTPQGSCKVLDFGLARREAESASGSRSNVTTAGMVVGTVAYMSPEQLDGRDADFRSDIFAFGVLLYELASGTHPFRSASPASTITAIMATEPAILMEKSSGASAELDRIVRKCLRKNPEERYQSARDLAVDLRNVRRDISGPRVALSQPHTPVVQSGTSNTRKRIALLAAAILLVVAGVFAALRFTRRPPVAHASTTIMIADLANRTGDPVFDGTVEPMLKLALEGAGFITAYDRTRVRDLGLPAFTEALDEQTALRVAVSQGLNVVVSGSLERKGTGYSLAMKATQAVTGNIITVAEDSVSSKDQVLPIVTKVATAIRKSLGDDTSDSVKLFAMERLSSASLEAVHEYAKGMEALSNNKNDEAVRRFSKSVELDPDFGLADAGRAIAYRNIGEEENAEKYIKQAISHVDRMTERERYRTRGIFYFVTGDYVKCVEEYSALTARYASDASAHNNLGICYSYLRNLPKTIEQMRLASEILPKRLLYRFNLAAFESLAGDFQIAGRDARSTLQMDPSYEKGYVILAMTQLGQNELKEAAESYRKLETVSPTGASFAASGFADLALYEGRFSEAVRILEKGAAADLAAKHADRAASKFAPLAYSKLLLGQRAEALSAAESALENSKDWKIQLLIGMIFAQTGEMAKARELSVSLASELQAAPQAYAKLVDAEIALADGKSRDAIRIFADANKLLDTWIGRFGLGRAYLADNAFAQADSEFDRCIERRGEAILLFMDEVPTYGYFPAVYYYQGRVRQGLKSPGAAKSYLTYLSIREKAGEDPLISEVRRLAGH